MRSLSLNCSTSATPKAHRTDHEAQISNPIAVGAQPPATSDPARRRQVRRQSSCCRPLLRSALDGVRVEPRRGTARDAANPKRHGMTTMNIDTAIAMNYALSACPKCLPEGFLQMAGAARKSSMMAPNGMLRRPDLRTVTEGFCTRPKPNCIPATYRQNPRICVGINSFKEKSP